VSTAPSADGRARRRKVEAELARHGFVRGPRRLAAGMAAAPPVERLRRVLVELGGGFGAFGRYLGSRPDLLGAADCLSFARLRDPRPSLAPAAVGELLERELGEPPERLFASFEEEPFAADPTRQAHRAWRADGRRLVVWIDRDDARRQIEEDLELLPLLGRAVPSRELALAPAIDDFRALWPASRDLGSTAAALADLARQDAAELLVAPRVEELSTPSVLCLEDAGGLPLGEVAGEAAVAQGLARRLARGWLGIALGGRTVPLEAEIEVLADGRLVLLGGRFSAAAGTAQAGLKAYLEAAAGHRPERVVAALEPHLGGSAAARTELARRLRQAVPARDGVLSADGESLADHLLLHWRLAVAHGAPPEPHLLRFYQGLWWLARSLVRLAGPLPAARDALRLAAGDLQWSGDWATYRQLADPLRMAAAMEAYLAAFSALPEQLELLLDPERRSPPSAVDRRAGARRPSHATTVVICLALLMAALVLVAGKLAPASGAAGAWPERIATLIFLALGVLLLKAVAGRGRS